MIIISSICIISFFFLVYLFLKKYIFDRKFSLQKGIDLIINLLKNHSIPIVFILENENPVDDLLICLKLSLKKKGLNYINIKDTKSFDNLYQVYNKFFNNKIVLFCLSLNHKILNKYLIKDKKNIIIFNLYYADLIKPLGKNITHCNHLIDRIKLIFNMNKDLNIMSIPDYLIFNELNLAYKIDLITKAKKKDILTENFRKIVIPKEYFLIDNSSQYLKIKSNIEDIYLWKKNTIYKKIFKVFYLNRVFSGINDSYDFYPLEHNYDDYQNDSKLNQIIYDIKKIKIVINSDIIVSYDLAMILSDLKNILSIKIDYNKIKNSTEIKLDENTNYIILTKKNSNFFENNVYVIDFLNYENIFNYIYSKILQANINKINKIEFCNLKNDILLISDNKINNAKIENFDLQKLVWIENINLIKVDIMNYLNLLKLKYNNICVHLILDCKTYYNIKLFLLLKKLNIKFIAYINKVFDEDEYIQEYGFNILNLKDKKSSFYQNKEILNFKNNLIIFSE